MGQLIEKAVVTTLLTLLVAGAAAAKTDSKVLVTAKNTKGSIAVAVGSAKPPVTRLFFTVKSVPPQKISIAWSLSCQTGATQTNTPGGNAPTATTEGVFKATAPLNQVVKLPSTHTLGCSLSVYSTLSKKGSKETVQILQN